jgi:hypothetical protein
MDGMKMYKIGCEHLKEEVSDELYDLYLHGVKSYKDINDQDKNSLLSKLCVVNLEWLLHNDIGSGDKVCQMILKDAILAQVFSLSLVWSCKNKETSSTYEAQLNNLLEIIKRAAETHFASIIDDGLAGLDEVPEYLDKVLHMH